MSGDLADSPKPLCPSAQPEWKDSVIIGVVGGTSEEPRVAYLDQKQPVTDELLRLAEPVQPTEVFRIAAPCLCKGCIHFNNEHCRLVENVIELLPQATDDLPECDIRPNCRWWLQEGKAACLRCPLVVTTNFNPSEAMREVVQTQAR